MKSTTRNFGLTMVIMATLIVIPTLGQLPCPPGVTTVSPCYCGAGWEVIECSDVPMEEVKAMFHRTPPHDWQSLVLTPLLNESIVPADLMGYHRVNYSIQLNSPGDSSYKMRVHPEAFASSRSSLSYVAFYHGDFSQIDFQFLTGFDQLNMMAINLADNVHLADWASMPDLPRLEILIFQKSTGLNGWSNFPTLSQGLSRLQLHDGLIQDEAMDRILNWTLTTSGNTLGWLGLSNNLLTRIPTQIPLFTDLEILDIYGQDRQGRGIEIIPTESLVFYSPFIGLNVENSNITIIEPGAFVGNFSKGFVTMDNNQLTRFESAVFESMLRDMVSYGDAWISARNNPFDCTEDPCHLAWLLRDNRELLLAFNTPPTCSDGIPFDELSPLLFAECP